MNRILLSICTGLFVASVSTFAAEEPQAQNKNIRYKSGKEVNFEELLIQGQIRRPEISVVTGSTEKGTDGLLRLREDFLDRVAEDQGEEFSR